MEAGDTLDELLARLRRAGVALTGTHPASSYSIDPVTREPLDNVAVVEGEDAWRALDEFVAVSRIRIDEPTLFPDEDDDDEPVPHGVDRISEGDVLLFSIELGVVPPDGIPASMGDRDDEPTVVVLSFLRQFWFERPDGEQTSPDLLRLLIAVPRTADLDDDRTREWGCGGPSALGADEVERWRFLRGPRNPIPEPWPGAEEWWAAVRAQSSFQICRSLTPLRAILDYQQL